MGLHYSGEEGVRLIAAVVFLLLLIDSGFTKHLLTRMYG